MIDDRCVHAAGDGQEIVRYDRAGKWWVEFPRADLRSARRISVTEAARLAVEIERGGGTLFRNLPGGGIFDVRVKQEEARGKDS